MKAGDVVDAVLIVDGNVLLDEVEQRHHEKGDLRKGRKKRDDQMIGIPYPYPLINTQTLAGQPLMGNHRWTTLMATQRKVSR